MSFPWGLLPACVRFLGSRVFSVDTGWTMAISLDGVGAEWEASEYVREYVRIKGSLFAPAARSNDVEITVSCGERNFHVLEPLAKRLLDKGWECGTAQNPSHQNADFLLHFYILFNILWLSSSSFICFICLYCFLFCCMLTVFVGHPLLLARMVKFYEKMMVPPPTAKLLKLEAKLAKKFTVLIKTEIAKRPTLPIQIVSTIDGSGIWSVWAGEPGEIFCDMLQHATIHNVLRYVTTCYSSF